MKGIFIHVPFLWIEGIALFPFVFTKQKKFGADFINHERIHLRQQLEMGVVFFYLWYLCEYLIHLIHLQNHYKAYRAISFEKEAYAHQSNINYLGQRSVWAFLRYL